jgi:hypothetical protein
MASRIAVILVSLLCFLASSYLTVEAWLLDSGKAENIRMATRWMPWSAEAWRLMPQVEPERAAAHWRQVLKLAPRDVEARLALAMDAELSYRPQEAEALLLEAATLHKGYLPAWTLANFYVRQGNQPQFWRWARRAATFEVDLTALFELALRIRQDPGALLAEFKVARPDALRQLLTAAGHQDLLERALPVADRVARLRTDAARELLLWDTDDLLRNGHPGTALAYWNLAASQHLLPYPVARVPTLVNGEFTYVTLERGFDWRPGSAEVSVNMGSGLHIGLYGKQEDTAVLLAQTVLLAPGHSYELRTRSRSNLPAGAHPIRWRLGGATSPAFEPGDWREARWLFEATTESTELRLMSHAELGKHRASGEFEIAWVQLAPAHAEKTAYAHR